MRETGLCVIIILSFAAAVCVAAFAVAEAGKLLMETIHAL